MTKGLHARQAAVQVLVTILQQRRSLTAVLPTALEQLPEAQQRALCQEFCYGVMRWQIRLQALVELLLQKPLRERDADIQCLLLLGLYQLIYLRIPPHAVVSETVQTTHSLGKAWAKGLVNGVLRRFQREQQGLLAQVDAEDYIRLSHPAWLLAAEQAAWPEGWAAIVEASNQRPPMHLRVNSRHMPRDDYLNLLAAAGMTAKAHPVSATGIILEVAVDVQQLPGFSAGWVSVQDVSAQLAAPLLAAQSGHHVLDACAAPGGKTAHILEQTPGITLTALDHDPARLQRVAENLTRLQFSATLVCADAREPDQWWDGCQFDRVLLDAPCSATGVIRRHPDIKYLRQAADISHLQQVQQTMLQALWPLLKPGGRLVYATCSILPVENSEQMAAFLASAEAAVEHVIDADWGRGCTVGRQLLPASDGGDGFYYAVLEKRG